MYNCKASRANTAIQKNVSNMTSANILRELSKAFSIVLKPEKEQNDVIGDQR